VRRRPLLGLAAILLAVSPVTASAADRPLRVGDKAPDFTLSGQHGKSVRLSELLAARRYVVLAFYVKAFTSG
jgi:peroxiredoxin Q/BCP